MRFAVLALLVTLTGCPFFEDDGDGSNYVRIDDVPAAAKDAWCTYLARCHEFPDKATCLGATVFNVPTFVNATTSAAIKAGRVVFEGSNVKLCLDALANDTCDRTDQNGRSNLLVCRDLVRGTVKAGGACTINEECISQLCSGGETDPVCMMGTCIGDTPPSLAPGKLGMPCAPLGGCEDGTYCDSATDMCLELKDASTECTVSYECGYGLGCAQARTGLQTCQALPQLGETCIDSQCRDEGQYCGPDGTCQQLGLAGASCISGSQQCSVYYPCDFGTSVCKAGPTLGMSCSGAVRCFAADTYCDSTTFMCTSLKANGEMCTSALQCQSDYCDQNSSPATCQTQANCF